MIYQIIWSTHRISIQKVITHIGILGNEVTDRLAYDGTTRNKPHPSPHIHIAHTAPYWLNGIPTREHNGKIRNLHAYMNKSHNKIEPTLVQSKFSYVDKRVSNDLINHKLSNHFWKPSSIYGTQIIQTLELWYTQYMGNHRNHISWLLIHPNPNCIFCPNIVTDTCPQIYFPHVRTNT